MTAQSLGQARHSSRHAHALVATVVHPVLQHVAVAVARLTDEEVLPLVFADPGAGACVELDDLLPALIRKVDQHHTRAADPAHHRVDHALHQGCGDGTIDSVAAVTQDSQPRLSGRRLRADDHAVHVVITSSASSIRTNRAPRVLSPSIRRSSISMRWPRPITCGCIVYVSTPRSSSRAM